MSIHNLVNVCSTLKKKMKAFDHLLDECMKEAEDKGVVINKRKRALQTSKYTEEQIAKIKELHKNGFTGKNISQLLGIPYTTVYYLLRI
jgi:hypothetical protein